MASGNGGSAKNGGRGRGFVRFTKDFTRQSESEVRQLIGNVGIIFNFPQAKA